MISFPVSILRPALAATFGLIGLGLCTGCAGRDHYVRGQEYVVEGEPDQAIVELREAVRHEPGNLEYQTTLNETQAAAAQLHYDRADRLVAESRYTEARAELQRTLELSPGHPQAPALMSRVDAELGSAPPAPAPPPVSEAMPRMPGPGPTPLPAGPPRPPVGAAVEYVPPPATQPITVDDRPAFPPGSFPFTLSRDDSQFPKESETLDAIIVRLKDTTEKPLRADVQVRVGKIVKRYRELREGSRISGRGESYRPYQITVLGIEPESETVSLLVEPVTRLPLR